MALLVQKWGHLRGQRGRIQAVAKRVAAESMDKLQAVAD